MEKLIKRISELAKAIAPTYPHVSTCEAWEQLYAIESSYHGVETANKDLHILIGLLQNELGWTYDQVLELWTNYKNHVG